MVTRVSIMTSGRIVDAIETTAALLTDKGGLVPERAVHVDPLALGHPDDSLLSLQRASFTARCGDLSSHLATSPTLLLFVCLEPGERVILRCSWQQHSQGWLVTTWPGRLSWHVSVMHSV